MADRYYIGARYVPAVYEGPDGSNTWLQGVAYDGLVIVTYGNYSYMSKKPVPAGMGSPDVETAYWIKAAVYNADVNNVVEQLDQKADKDGVYPDLFAGNLISDTMQTDNAPYLERETGAGLSNIAPLCYPALVGASVAENQLIDYATITANSGTVTVTDETAEYTFTAITENVYSNAISTPNPAIVGRKYLMIADVKLPHTPSASRFNLYIGGQYKYFTPTANTRTTCIAIASATINNSAQVHFAPLASDGYVVGDKCYVYDWQVIDLTQMLGSTIADYAYTLEQATAGSGIAWLRSYGLLGGYKAYNSGSIESVEVTEKKCVGFNQWDEEWEVGIFNYNTGLPLTASNQIRSKNYIPVIPNTTYYIKAPGAVLVLGYDKDKTFLRRLRYTTGNATFVTRTVSGDDCYYIKFCTIDIPAYGATYNDDICINLSSDRNGEYESYKSTSYDLGSDTLRGIFKLDANNKLYADGDRKTADGLITRRYAEITLDGSESGWTKSSSYPGSFYINFNVAGIPQFASFSYCVVEDLVSVVDIIDYAVGCVYCESISVNFWYPDKENMTLSEFKSWLATNPIHMVYKLATPTTEQGDTYTSPQLVYPDGSEEFVTENDVPVGHETKYPYDLKGILEQIADVPAADGTYTLRATRTGADIIYTWDQEV